MTVSLLEILAAARAHVAPLAAESAGYLLLAVTDHVVAAPRPVAADEVELMPDGGVRLRARRGVVADAGAEQMLRQLLARTLEVSSSVGPALRRAAQRKEDAGLPALVRELETALIPVNRSAAKRALSRLHRETERAKSSGKLPALLDAEGARIAAAVAVPVVAAQVVVAPVVAAPVVPAQVVAAQAIAVPVVAAPAVAAPAVAEAGPLAAELPDLSPPALPVVKAASLPLVTASPRRPHKPASLPAEFTPEPRLAVGEPAFTKPEPVILRAKQRGNSTPRLGTLVTLQTLPGEEDQRTERAPTVTVDDLSIDVVLDEEIEAETPATVAAAAPQPFVDPEPSRMPDVLTAMLELHTGVDADEAPTRIRHVVTELRSAPTAAPELAPTIGAAVTAAPKSQPLAPTPEPEAVEDAWLTNSSLTGVQSEPHRFESELVEPAIHDALTWNPGPVAPAVGAVALPPALVIVEPLPEPSPYAPAVLPTRASDVSELLDSFHVSDAAEERDLRSALKVMAGLELTPMPHPYVEEG